jgi:hypothetical protein
VLAADRREVLIKHLHLHGLVLLESHHTGLEALLVLFVLAVSVIDQCFLVEEME